MVAKIRLEAEDATGAAFDSVQKKASETEQSLSGVQQAMNDLGNTSAKLDKEFAGVAASQDKTADSSKDLTKQTDSLQNVVNEFDENVKRLRRELDALASDQDRVSASTNRLDGNLQNATSGSYGLANGLGGIGSGSGLAVSAMSQLDAAQNEVASGTAAMNNHLNAMKASGGGAAAGLNSVNTSLAGTASASQAASVGSESLLNVMLKLWAAKEVFMKLAQGVVYLAEQGNPAAEGLVERFKELQKTLISLSETEHFQHMLDGITGSIAALDDGLGALNGEADNTQSSMSGMLEATQSWTAQMVASTGEMIGVFAEGHAETQYQMNEERTKRRENHEEIMAQKKLEAEISKQTAEVGKIEAGLKQAQAEEEFSDQLKLITLAKDAADRRDAEIQKLKDLAKEGNLSTEQQQESAKKIAALDAKQRELTEKTANEADKLIQDGLDKEKAAVAERTALNRKEAEEKTRIRKEVADKSREQAAATAEKELSDLQTQAEKLRGIVAGASGPGGENVNMNALGGGVASRGKAAKHLIEQNVNNAVTSVDKDFDSKFTRGTSGKFLEDGAQEAYQKELSKAKKQASRETKQDIRSGKADEKLDEIQQDFANGYLNQQAAEGKLGKTALEALRSAVAETIKRKDETESLNQQMEEIRNVVQGLGETNTRRTSQRRG